MNNKTILIVFFAVIFIGLIIGLATNFRGNSVENASPNEPIKSEGNVTSIPIEITATKAPSPTWPPLGYKVKSVSPQKIIVVTSTGGEMTIPTDRPGIKVYVRNDAKLDAGSFSDLKVGQNITLIVTVPGKEGQVIIEK